MPPRHSITIAINGHNFHLKSVVFYSKKNLKALGDIIDKKNREHGSVIYFVSDEPYRKIVFDDIFVPPVHGYYKNSIAATLLHLPFKDLSLPGKRSCSLHRIRMPWIFQADVHFS